MATGIPAGLDTSRWSAADGRRFAFTVGAAFAVISGLLWWRGMSTASAVSGSAGVLLVLGGLVIPRRLGPVYRAWMTLAHAMSRVTTPIFMGIVY
ncbi:MAG: hypothetical protein H0U67_15445, partial [Gemmatimonadetes bacterium]|nr:hypothetical protein [Gemmatimonadota bacterium]